MLHCMALVLASQSTGFGVDGLVNITVMEHCSANHCSTSTSLLLCCGHKLWTKNYYHTVTIPALCLG